MMPRDKFIIATYDLTSREWRAFLIWLASQEPRVTQSKFLADAVRKAIGKK